MGNEVRKNKIYILFVWITKLACVVRPALVLVFLLAFFGCGEKSSSTTNLESSNLSHQSIENVAVEKTKHGNAKQEYILIPETSEYGLSIAKDLKRSPAMLVLSQPDNNVDPLIADQETDKFFPSRLSIDGKELDEGMFQNPQICGSCHKEIYQQWKGSVMAFSWDDPIYRAVLERASDATQGKIDNFCIGCHTPIGLTTGNAEVKGEVNAIASRGVDCEICHNISNIEGIGNGAFVLTPNKYGRPLIFGPRSDAKSPFHDTVYSDLHTKSEFCSSCHNVTHPFNKLAIERTYDEWRDSVYNGEGIECQDCHMTPGPGVKENPGKSASMGKQREHIYSHQFAGANVTLLKHFGQNEAADAASEMLKSAATMQFMDVPL